MSRRTGYLIMSILSLISTAVSHSAHSNHSQNTTSSSQSAVNSLISGYPDSTMLIAVTELLIGVLLLIAAVWHFRKN